MGEWQGLISQLSWWQIVLFFLIGIIQVLLLILTIGSFFLAFVSLLQILAKSGWPYIEPEDAKLSWARRTAKCRARAASASSLALSPEFAKEWKRLGIGVAVFLCCLAVVFIFAILAEA